MKDEALSFSLLASFFIHGVAIILASFTLKHTVSLRHQDFLPVSIVDVPRQEEPKPTLKIDTPPEVSKPPSPPAKVEKPRELKPAAKSETVQPKPATMPAAPPKEEPVQPIEAKPPPVKSDAPTPLSPSAKIEGGGSEAGVGNLFGKGDVAVVPGSGTAGGGGGTASSGSGRGSSDPGLPAATAPLRTNREAKPIQTVRAVYPPLALRMGMEGDVTLRIEIDMKAK